MTTPTSTILPFIIENTSKESNKVYIEFQKILSNEDALKCADLMALFTYSMAIYAREIFNQPTKFTKKYSEISGKIHRNKLRIIEAIDTGADADIIKVRRKMTLYRQQYKQNPQMIYESHKQKEFMEFVNDSINTLVNVVLAPVYIKSPNILNIVRKYENVYKKEKKSKHLNYEAFTAIIQNSESV
jgi:hypothetical protein